MMGDRLADEVKTVIKSKPGVKKISFIAHSLGGLVARYAIGRLYEPPLGSNTGVQNGLDLIDSDFVQHAEEKSEGKIAGLEPVNFITFATPHLGSRGHKQVQFVKDAASNRNIIGKSGLPLLCGLHLLEKVASFSAHWFVGRTGRHLFLTDGDDGKPPLLLRMVTDCGDLYFMSALRAFKRRVAYSNVSYDRILHIKKLRWTPLNEKYPHIVNVENGNGDRAVPRAAKSKRDHVSDEIEGLPMVLLEIVAIIIS
eukprot:Gb_21642 [translate_table: standard]